MECKTAQEVGLLCVPEEMHKPRRVKLDTRVHYKCFSKSTGEDATDRVPHPGGVCDWQIIFHVAARIVTIISPDASGKAPGRKPPMKNRTNPEARSFSVIDLFFP